MARADDANPLSALAVGNEHHQPPYCTADGDFPALFQRMIGIRERHREGVEENGCRIFKGDSVLPEIRDRFTRVPLKCHDSQF